MQNYKSYMCFVLTQTLIMIILFCQSSYSLFLFLKEYHSNGKIQFLPNMKFLVASNGPMWLEIVIFCFFVSGLIVLSCIGLYVNGNILKIQMENIREGKTTNQRLASKPNYYKKKNIYDPLLDSQEAGEGYEHMKI